MLAENRFSKYLLYAVGEIILVVIGILIALQINNSNEAKNNKQRFVKVLKEMRQDLKTDLQNSVWVLNEGKEMDSLVDLVLDEKLTSNDYLKKGNRMLFWIGLQYAPFDYQKTGFRKFENFQGIIPQEFDSITTTINTHYNIAAKFYDDTYNRLRDQIKDRHDFLSRNYEWYYKLRRAETTDKMIDFYLKNPVYKNWVSQHKVDNTASKYGSVKRLEASAFSLIIEINRYLNDSDDFIKENQQLHEKYGEPISDKEDWIGQYKDTKTKQNFSIYNVGGYLFLNSLLLKRAHKDTLVYSSFQDWVIIANRNEKGKIKGVFIVDKKNEENKSYSNKLK